MSRRLFTQTGVNNGPSSLAVADLATSGDKITLSPADVANCTEFGVYIDFDATSSAGTVLIETARDASYTGTWAVLGTINWAAISKSHYSAITGVLGALKVRCSSTITGGSAKVTIIGNQQ